jgi:RNA polymerase sigma-B factor
VSLSQSDDARDLRIYADARDPRLRDELTRRYLPLARHAAARYKQSGEPSDDLVQVASIGLLKAIERFDPERGLAFSSFAMPTMTGEVRRYLRDRSWTVRPPRDLQDRVLAMDQAVDHLSTELGRAPDAGELANWLRVEVETIVETMQAASARHGVSLSTPLHGQDAGDATLQDSLGGEDDGYAAADERAMARQLTEVLTDREREVLRLRFEEDLVQQEIGERIGVSQMHVSRIIRHAIEKLRAAAEPGGDGR